MPEPTTTERPRPPAPIAAISVLGAAVLALSVAAPLVRLAHSPPLVVATWRLGLSTAIVAALTLATGSWRQWRTLTRRELAWGLVAGVALAAHFWSWIASLGMTSVAASVVLVNLQPVFVAAGSAWWLAEHPSRRQWGGVLIAAAGALVVGAGDWWRTPSAATTGSATLGGAALGRDALVGDGLALVGAATAAAYYLIGRRLRAALDLWAYTTLVYGSCWLTLLVVGVGTGAPLWPLPADDLWIFAALAAGPMLVGHTGMNWALAHLPAYIVNLTVLGEPIGATLLAWWIPAIGESPTWWTLLGGGLVLFGAIRTARR
jgi:drug/metabolite transporter (DMT)-like permease